ncbi:MAG: hypothetical protein IPK71_03815 [Myxococcales bacterium]|nr:hypothetical protein [Myxococcales bacterium]
MSAGGHAPHEGRCSVCGAARAGVAYLVVAARASICDRCVVRLVAEKPWFERVRALFFVVPEEPALPRRGGVAYRDGSPTACSFCGLERRSTRTYGEVRLCRPCIELAHEVLLERGVSV